jgi:hypothetical protein
MKIRLEHSRVYRGGNRPSGIGGNSEEEEDEVSLFGRLMIIGTPPTRGVPIRCWILSIALLKPSGSLIWSMNL